MTEAETPPETPAAPAPPAPISQGTYALFQTPAGGLHLVYRVKGAEQDTHMEIPPFVVSMATKAAGGGGSPADVMKMLGGIL